MSNLAASVSREFGAVTVGVNAPAVFSSISFDIRDTGQAPVQPGGLAGGYPLSNISAYLVPGNSKVSFLATDPTDATPGGNDDYAISAATAALFQKQSGHWVQIAVGPGSVAATGSVTLDGWIVTIAMQERVAITSPVYIGLGNFDLYFGGPASLH